MIDKNTPSGDIPRRPWFSRYVDHEVGSCGITSSCAMTRVLPLYREPGNPRVFRRAAIGRALFKEIVEFTTDQFLDEIQSALKCVA